MAKRQTGNYQLPPGTVIEVVAYTPDDKSYIFEITFGEWLTMKRKPGVYYRAFEKGYYSARDAIRVDYYKTKNKKYD